MKKSNRLVRATIGLAICLVFLVSVFAINAFADSTTGAAVRIGETEFNTVGEAIDAANAGDVVTFLRDVTETDGIIIDKDLKINLNGFTYTVTEGLSTNNRNIKVIGSASLDVYNGRMVAQGGGTTKDNGTGLYGTVRFESTGELSLTDLELENYRPWGLNVKVLSGSATLNNVHITSRYGGGIEVSEGFATLENCSVTQTGKYDHCSTAVSVSNNGYVIVYGGTYTTDNYAVNTMSSGGMIVVYAGQFKAPTVINIDAENDVHSNIEVLGGSFEGDLNNNNPAAINSGIIVFGGTYDRAIPLEFIGVSYDPVSIGGGKYTVTITDGVAINHNSGVSYDTVQEAILEASEDDFIHLNGSVVIDSPLVIDKSLTLVGFGYGIVYTGSDRAINIPSVDGTELRVTIYDVSIYAPNAQRGINFSENGLLDIQHVNILPTFGKVPIYGINAPAIADGADIVLFNTNVYANIAVNLWGEDMYVGITDSTLVSIDNNSYENYAAVKINNDGENSADRTEVRINDSTVIAKDENGEPSAAFTNSAKDSKFVIENSYVTGEEVRYAAVVRYENGTSYSFTSLKDAVEVAVRDGREVTIIADVTESDIITIAGKLTINGNGYTLKSTASRIINIDTDEEVTINDLDIVGEGGSERGINVINKSGKVNLSYVRVSEVTHYALHVARSAGAVEINIDNCFLEAYGALAIYGEETYVQASDSDFGGINTFADNGSNDFATIAVGADNVTVHIFGGSVYANAYGDTADQAIVGAVPGSSSGLVMHIDSEILVIGKAEIIGFAREDNPTIILRAEYADELAKAGFGTKATSYQSLVSVDFENEVHVVEYVVDGEVIATFFVEVGKSVENIPSIPEKEGYTEFAPAWDRSSSNITENTVITAVYFPNKYEITLPTDMVGFTVKAPETVDYGGNAYIAVTTLPEYFKGEKFTLTVNGEEIVPNSEGIFIIENVREDLTVEVSGVERITYTVAYEDGVSNESVFPSQVHTGLVGGTKTPAFVGEPVREGYTFMGWTPEVAEAVTASVTYKAVWELIPVHVHTDEDGKWEHFGNNHFYTCACGEHFDITPCSGGSATCKDQAICEVCLNGYGDTLEHKYSIPTCETLATCTECGATTGELAPHRYGDATCEAKATCSECGVTKGELAAHKDSDGDGKCDTCELVLTSDPADGGNGDNTAEEEGGLSGGAIAAIVIGAVLVLGGGGFALYWFVIRKKSAV